MRCPDCRTEMTKLIQDYRYVECGLPNVILRDAERRYCPDCGQGALSLFGLERLHTRLAHMVALRPGSLTPAEVRFLRKHMGWSAEQFADRLEVALELVERWEGGEQMTTGAEKTLRQIALSEAPTRDYGRELAALVVAQRPRDLEFVLAPEDDEWHSEAAHA